MSHQPRKRFGQNFLHDLGVIRRIVDSIHPRPGEHLVEIGPGQGALTRPLLEACGRLDVVELDRDLIAPLQQQLADTGELHVHQADALRFDFCALCEKQGAEDTSRLRVVGNLPYNISTPLLFHLMQQASCIEDMHFMLQKEVVQRIVAAPGNKNYGRLTVMLAYYCESEMLFSVGSGAFFPAPKVDSAIVRLRPHPQPPVEVQDPALLAQLVAQAFSQRRKTLRNNLKGWLSADTITALDIDPGIRAERLSLAQFACLTNALQRPAPASEM